jgi:hypothetical protein
MIDVRRAAEQAHQIFEENDWQWATTAGVPTVDDLEIEMLRLLRDAYRPNVVAVATGRLRVINEYTGDEAEGLPGAQILCLELGWRER